MELYLQVQIPILHNISPLLLHNISPLLLHNISPLLLHNISPLLLHNISPLLLHNISPLLLHNISPLLLQFLRLIVFSWRKNVTGHFLVYNNVYPITKSFISRPKCEKMRIQNIHDWTTVFVNQRIFF